MIVDIKIKIHRIPLEALSSKKSSLRACQVHAYLKKKDNRQDRLSCVRKSVERVRLADSVKRLFLLK